MLQVLAVSSLKTFNRVQVLLRDTVNESDDGIVQDDFDEKKE